MDVIMLPEIMLTTSGLSILLHGVISLPDATSYDKINFLSGWPGLYHAQKELAVIPESQTKLLTTRLWAVLFWWHL